MKNKYKYILYILFFISIIFLIFIVLSKIKIWENFEANSTSYDNLTLDEKKKELQKIRLKKEYIEYLETSEIEDPNNSSDNDLINFKYNIEQKYILHLPIHNINEIIDEINNKLHLKKINEELENEELENDFMDEYSIENLDFEIKNLEKSIINVDNYSVKKVKDILFQRINENKTLRLCKKIKDVTYTKSSDIRDVYLANLNMWSTEKKLITTDLPHYNLLVKEILGNYKKRFGKDLDKNKELSEDEIFNLVNIIDEFPCKERLPYFKKRIQKKYFLEADKCKDLEDEDNLCNQLENISNCCSDNNIEKYFKNNPMCYGLQNISSEDGFFTTKDRILYKYRQQNKLDFNENDTTDIEISAMNQLLANYPCDDERNLYLYNEKLKIDKKAREKEIANGLLMRGYSRKLREFNTEFEDCKDNHTNFMGNILEFESCI